MKTQRKNFVKRIISTALAAAITTGLILSLSACSDISDILGNIVTISTIVPEGYTYPPKETDAPATPPPATPLPYVYVPDPNEVFADDSSRTAAKLADGPIAEGYKALSAFPDDPDVVILDYNPANHPLVYSVLSDSKKKIYDTVYNAAKNFGTYHYNETEEEPGFINELLGVNDAINIDHPEIAMYSRFDFQGWDVSPAYFLPSDQSAKAEPDVAKVRDAVNVYYRTFDRILEKMPDGITNYQKCIYLCAVISGICTYDRTYESTLDRFPAYGTLVSGICVCQGYAQTFMLLAQAAGIECDRTWGVVYDEGHVWNRVQTSKGELYIDPTWTDNVVEERKSDVLFVKKYFLMTPEELEYYSYTEVTNKPSWMIDYFK